MSVFTIYCHGTGSHRTKSDKEIVTCLGRRAQGTEYRDYLILDGVGAGPKDKSGKNPMAGTFDWSDKNKGAKSSDVSVEMGGSKKTKGFTYGRESAPVGGGGMASAIGYGVEDNARHAIVAIADLPELPETINLIGWSRGAVTALVIANMLYDPSTTEGLFRGIKVNIFAVDPVAGLDAGTKDGAESRRLIPSNVKNYLGVVNTGENRKSFSPQDLSRVIVLDPAASNVVFLPFPGKHNSCADNSDPKTQEVSDIAWTLGTRFLGHWGSRIAPPPMTWSDRAMLARYCAITVKAEQYAGVKQKGLIQRVIGLGYGDRSVKKELSGYTRYSDYFVNEHHRRLFLRLLPHTYAWLFTRSNATPGLTGRKVSTTSGIGAEIAGAAGYGGSVLPSLAQLGVHVDGTIVSLPAPGSAMDDRVDAYRQTGDLVTMGVLE